ncbi:MAG: hypothetical protein HY329_19835 [Chloroflexi bacterium]|nr:hypothetical protein [Chloroflexota bacterium]
MPAVVVCTEPFLPMAKLEAQALGVPDLKVAAIQHPLGGQHSDAVRESARHAVSQIIAALTTSAQPVPQEARP